MEPASCRILIARTAMIAATAIAPCTLLHAGERKMLQVRSR